MMGIINPGSSQFKNTLIVLHLTFAIIGIYIFFYNYSASENLLVQKTLSQQAVLSRAGARSIENFLNNIENQLFSFTVSFQKTDEAAPIDKDGTRFAFQSYFQKAISPVNEIALYDEEGKLLVIENRQRIKIGEGQNFSDRDFIIWSKNPLNNNKIFISSSYTARAGSSAGQNIIAFVSPLYFGTRYKGTLAIRILVDQFQNAFISPLNPGFDENAYIIDSDGTLRAGNSDLTNKNLVSYAKEKKWKNSEDFIDKLEQSLRKNEIQTTWAFQNPKEGKEKTLLASVNRINVPNTDNDLFLIVTTSKDAVSSAINNLRLYGVAWLGFGLITTILGGLIVVLLKP